MRTIEACAPGLIALYPATGANEYNAVLCLDPAALSAAGLGNLTEANASLQMPVAINYGADMDMLWLLVAGAMVFLMQAGFSMLEAGSVRAKNTVNILYKNILDACIGAIAFWLVGYAFAYGDSAGGFIGTTNFGLSSEGSSGTGWHMWFFQFCFAATAATIVSGSVAERTKFSAYFVYSIVITAFIYPVVVHWGWGSGFLSAWGAVDGPLLSKNTTSNGLVDFAGSGVVHMVGGFAGLVGAIVVGPRLGRFDAAGKPIEIKAHSHTLQSLGVVILWFGWYGFNAGSTLCALGCMNIAAKVAVTTTIAAASACITGAFISRLEGQFNLTTALNSVIAGLVSVTAPCSVIEPWAAFVIGIIGAIVFICSSKLLVKLRIDDPLDAAPLHGFCGIWGVLSVGIFGTDANAAFAGYPNTPNTAFASGEQFAVQLIAVLAILTWTVGTSAITFLLIKLTIGMRVPPEVEEMGLDMSEHGAMAYYDEKYDEKMAKMGGAVPTAVVSPAPV